MDIQIIYQNLIFLVRYLDSSFECQIKGQLSSLAQLKEEIRKHIDELEAVNDFKVEWYNPEFKEVNIQLKIEKGQDI